MTFADLNHASGGMAAFLTVIIIGWLPTEMWRVLAVWMARDLDENSEILVWVRLVASALLAAVVAKIVLTPSGAMATVPVWGRVGGIFVGLAVLFLTRKNVIAAVVAGEAALLLAGMLSR